MVPRWDFGELSTESLLKFTKFLVIFTEKSTFLENRSNDFALTSPADAPGGILTGLHSGFPGKIRICEHFDPENY